MAILVSGTWGNGEDWCSIVPEKVSFASNLLDGLCSGSDVVPFLWASANQHTTRLEAAKNLATEIDSKSKGFEQVWLVGHSHGGNVAMLAAANCKTKLAGVICLATPFPHLKLKSGTKTWSVPIYCPPATMDNVGQIYSFVARNDSVVNSLASAFPGLSENEAIATTNEWRQALNHPRLHRDDAMFRFFGQSNIHTFPSLALNGPKQVSLWSMASDVDSHAYIKSATMGSCIGGLINSNGSNCPEKFVIAENGDNGNTVSLLDYSDKKSKLGKVVRIFEIEIELRASAKDSDSNGSLPDPFVEIFDAKTNKLIGRTDRRVGAMSASWKDTAFLIRGEQEIIIRVKDAEFLGSRDLGGLVGRFSEISKWESDKWTVKFKSEDLSSDSFPTTPDFR